MITTPPRISPAILRFCEELNPSERPEYLPVRPEPHADLDECFFNVRTKVERDGGQIEFGWAIWEWPSTFIEVEFHSVWRSPDGDRVDITPKKDNETRILFLRDSNRTFNFETRERISSVRRPLTNHPDVLEYLDLASRRAELISRYRRGTLASVPAEEIDPIEDRLRQLKPNLLRRRVGENEPCPCGSRRNYRRCCGSGR